tara:strand:- start:85 stop:372 length:288 start_codon:yes stop_codon:yes gene_type:complete
MDKTATAQRFVVEAIGELNLQRVADEQIGLDAAAPLFGDGPLDSLGLVQLIAELENRIETENGRRINLADDEVLAADAGPFASVGALAAYVAEVL